MITEIKEGDVFDCIKDFERSGVNLFTEGKQYLSDEDHCISDDKNHSQFGWNLEILNQHFTKSSLNANGSI